MKTYLTNLQSNIVSSYDKTKTTIQGRVAQKTLPAPFNSTTVLGAPLTKFLDIQTDTLGSFLPGMMYQTNNGRLFVLMSAPATGLLNQIVLYNFNLITGAYSYVGKIAFSIAAATAAMKGFKVDDSNTSNIKIFLGHTSTVIQTGGIMMINKVTLASFVPTGFPTYYTALTNDVAGVYSLQLPNEVGGANTMTTLAGVSLPGTYSANGAINTKLYAHNGISATHQFNIFDYSAAPQIAGMGVTTVTAANTTGVNTTFTMTGNTLAVNDMVVITSNAPTGYTNTAVNSVQSFYYVVATNFVSGSTFSLSLTLGGAILAASTTSTTTTFARAMGQSTNLFVAKTANLTTLGAGTLLITNSENYCMPSTGANAGQDCVFMATSTNFLTGRLADLYSTQTGTLNGTITVTGLTSTAGLSIGQTIFGTGIPAATTIATIAGPTSITMNNAATTSGAQSLNFGANAWPSLLTVNVLGTGLDYVVPSPLNAIYDSALDKVLYLVTGGITMIKNFVNSAIAGNFGNTGNVYMEAQNHITDPVQFAATNSMEAKNGWVFYSSSATTGQRGIVAFDLRADSGFEYSYVVSPVIATPGSQTLNAISSVEQMFDYTGGGVFQYRTSANLADAVFSTATGGWTTIGTSQVLNIPLNNYTQFRALSTVIATPSNANAAVTTPFQLVDLEYTVSLLAEISDNWDFSYNDSSSAIPTRVGFNLRTAYASGTVPKLYFRAYDTAGVLLTTADTVTNASNFQYSTDLGVTWLPLGTIPNTPNTRIRYTYTSPPGVEERVSLKES